MSYDHTTVVAYLPLPQEGHRGQGILSELRGVVAMARRRHPHLAACSVVDVDIKQAGDRMEATVVFADE